MATLVKMPPLDISEGGDDEDENAASGSTIAFQMEHVLRDLKKKGKTTSVASISSP